MKQISRTFSIYYQNVRGTRTKTDTLYTNILTEDYDIIVLTETWLNSDIHNGEIFDNRYDVVRKDRSSGKLGGGVLIALKKQISYEIISTNCESESVILKIKFKKSIFIISVVYFVPNSKVDVYEGYLSHFDDLLLLNNVNFIILGDFNLPHLFRGQIQTDVDVLMRGFMNLNGVRQFNSVGNCIGRTLDLVLSNVDISQVCRSSNTLVREDAYHPALEMMVNFNEERAKVGHPKLFTYNFKKGNFILLYNLLRECDWTNVLTASDVDASVEHFYNKLYFCLDASVPKYVVGKRVSSLAYPLWFSPELKKKIKRKNTLHSLIIKNKATENQQIEYKKLRQEVKAQAGKEFLDYHKSLEFNINNDPSSFWGFINGKRKQIGLPREMRLGCDTFGDPVGIARAFAQYFASVYEECDVDQIRLQNDCWGNFMFSKIEEGDVINSIKKLKPKKCTGTDNIPPYIYKGCADHLAQPLTHIFNLAIKNCYFPTAFKQTIVSPIHKNGEKCLITNYRPISLLNGLAKIFESVLYDNILQFVCPKISQYQHGFVPHKSTVSNLLIFSEHAAQAINEKKQMDVIYTDCARAFDKVDHSILLGKLVDYGFSKEAYTLMKSYLCNRSQAVKISHEYSEEFKVTSGVPQGSNLGPLLFIMFINDLPNNITRSTSLLYADDFKLFKTISDRNDSVNLQNDLNSVTDWFQRNKMKLNTDKCFIMSFTRRICYSDNDYVINGVKLERRSEAKDLGVVFQPSLKFNNHYSYISNRAYGVLGFVIRNSKNFDISTVVRLYNALVRPHLEYASNIWLPTAVTNINIIEKVQKKLLRFLYVRKNNQYPYMVSYRALTDSFNFQTLCYRRKTQAVLFVFCVINSIKYQDCSIINFIYFRVPKVNLRIYNFNLFHEQDSVSPLNALLNICNEILDSLHVDLFTISFQKLKLLLNQRGT